MVGLSQGQDPGTRGTPQHSGSGGGRSKAVYCPEPPTSGLALFTFQTLLLGFFYKRSWKRADRRTVDPFRTVEAFAVAHGGTLSVNGCWIRLSAIGSFSFRFFSLDFVVDNQCKQTRGIFQVV